MLGTFRLLLALLVALSHLHWSQLTEHFGLYAVYGFYVLSGYLMTRVLNETYHFSGPAFALNRFLRLYPLYYLVAGLTLIIITVLPGAGAFHDAWGATPTLWSIFGNLFIVPLGISIPSFRVVTVGWSVGVELACYFFLWLFGARNKAAAWAMFAIGLACHALILVLGYDWEYRYVPIYSAFLPFGCGALIYFYSDTLSTLSRAQKQFAMAAVFTAWLVNLIAGQFSPHTYFYYSNLALVVAIICLGTQDIFVLGPLDKWLGDLAYPLFLTHWIVAFCVSSLLLHGRMRGGVLFLTSIVFALAISWLLARLSDRAIEPIRDRVRLWARRPGDSLSAMRPDALREGPSPHTRSA
jgi:peptidoglycan/LPS O-acetylase OafA/YrhL